MDKEARAALEASIRDAAQGGDTAAALTRALDGYGSELFGFLMSLLRDRDLADDAFQELSIDVWNQLGSFEWRSSFRTWVYRLARGAASRRLRDPARKRGQRLGTVEQQELSAKAMRTATAMWRQTEQKSKLWQACEALPDDDRTLVLLRISRGMSWLDVAAVTADEDQDDEQLTRRAAAQRKRFERIKDKLRTVMKPD